MTRLMDVYADPYRKALAQARAPCIPFLGTSSPPIIIIATVIDPLSLS
jgi:hypothetical protein